MSQERPRGARFRFHAERKHLDRARGPLPFPVSSELDELVRAAQTAAEAAPPRTASDNPHALLPDALELLAQLAERVAPELIVEFGSGESTRVFARWAAAHEAALVSIEHDRGWVEEVTRRLPVAERSAVRVVHLPLRPLFRGLRQFFSYGRLEAVERDVSRARLMLLDGPHISGREVVLHLVLTRCHPGAVVVIDDFGHYAVREMLSVVPPELAACFAAVTLNENSHGLCVLRCLRPPVAAPFPPGAGLRAILRSHWRSLRDRRRYGTGD